MWLQISLGTSNDTKSNDIFPSNEVFQPYFWVKLSKFSLVFLTEFEWFCTVVSEEILVNILRADVLKLKMKL